MTSDGRRGDEVTSGTRRASKKRIQVRKSSARAHTPRVNIAGMTRFFAQQPDVIVAYLFGSVARGQGDHFSDVDIAVLLDERVPASRHSEMRLQFAADLAPFADREVQVVDLAYASPVLKMQVLREGRLLHARTEGERIAFEVDAAQRYYDTQPLRAFQRRVIFAEGGIGGPG